MIGENILNLYGVTNQMTYFRNENKLSLSNFDFLKMDTECKVKQSANPNLKISVMRTVELISKQNKQTLTSDEGPEPGRVKFKNRQEDFSDN